jgi:hypothetical protein
MVVFFKREFYQIQGYWSRKAKKKDSHRKRSQSIFEERNMKSLKDVNEILKEHKEELFRKYSVVEIGVFGSFVRGEEKRRSDIDILVEFEKVPDLLEFIALEEYLRKLLKKKVDLIRKEAVRHELKDRILKEVIYI